MKRPFPFHSNAVWPPLWVVVSLAIVYGLFSAFVWLVAVTSRIHLADIADMQEMAIWRRIFFGAVVAGYAVYRLFRFHPFFNRGYRAWLAWSPWTPDRPLPLGPVHLVWQDAAVIGALMVVAAWHAHVDPLLQLGVFGLVYCGGLTLLLAVTGCAAFFLALGFLWPALLLPAARGWPSFGLVAVLLVVLGRGYLHSRKSFTRPPRSEKSIWQTDLSMGSTANLGWPYKRLSPGFSSVPLSLTMSLLVSLLIGWWYYCIATCSDGVLMPELIVIFACMAGLLRSAQYCSAIAPPFNLWGRLVTGRLIVPGFDQVFLTPLMAVLLGFAGCILIRHSGSWHVEAEACVIAALWFLLLGGGPTYRKWILTGQHRFRPPPATTGEKRLLKSI